MVQVPWSVLEGVSFPSPRLYSRISSFFHSTFLICALNDVYRQSCFFQFLCWPWSNRPDWRCLLTILSLQSSSPSQNDLTLSSCPFVMILLLLLFLLFYSVSPIWGYFGPLMLCFGVFITVASLLHCWKYLLLLLPLSFATENEKCYFWVVIIFIGALLPSC